MRTEHEIEIDRIHDRQLAEKDAEIERLKQANKSITFQYLRSQGEIEDWKENERRALSLISELCDALAAYRDLHWQELIQRAREVNARC